MLDDMSLIVVDVRLDGATVAADGPEREEAPNAADDTTAPFAATRDELAALGAGALKRLARARGVDASSCVEKAHLVDALVAASVPLDAATPPPDAAPTSPDGAAPPQSDAAPPPPGAEPPALEAVPEDDDAAPPHPDEEKVPTP